MSLRAQIESRACSGVNTLYFVRARFFTSKKMRTFFCGSLPSTIRAGGEATHSLGRLAGKKFSPLNPLHFFASESDLSYNESMICPNDNIGMHQVRIESHYGQPIILEQCKGCGGIWFDESELYRAKHGEAEKIELLNSESLRTLSQIKSAKLLCPKDQGELIRFNDTYFPIDIIVGRCVACDGFWLKRGEFVKYQKTRQELQRPKEKSIGDKKFEENIEKILALHSNGGATDVLGKLGKFLSTPIDQHTLRPLDSTRRTPTEDRVLNLTLDILTLILNALIRR